MREPIKSSYQEKKPKPIKEPAKNLYKENWRVVTTIIKKDLFNTFKSILERNNIAASTLIRQYIEYYCDCNKGEE